MQSCIHHSICIKVLHSHHIHIRIACIEKRSKVNKKKQKEKSIHYINHYSHIHISYTVCQLSHPIRFNIHGIPISFITPPETNHCTFVTCITLFASIDVSSASFIVAKKVVYITNHIIVQCIRVFPFIHHGIGTKALHLHHIRTLHFIHSLYNKEKGKKKQKEKKSFIPLHSAFHQN